MTASDPPRTTEPRRRLADHPVVARLAGAAPWLVPCLIVAVSAILLLNRLGEPPRIIFDETYYVDDARWFLITGGVEESFAVHPPVGKWLIAASIQLVGDTAVGWRLAGALSGVGMVLLTYLLALRLLRTRWQAALAAGLLAADGLFIVQARTSMLDIFLAFFVLLGAWLLVRDLQDLDQRSLSPGGLLHRPLRDRWLAGLAFGLAIGTKWSGLLALGTALVLVAGFEVLAHRRTHRKGLGFGRLLWVLVGPMLLLPATVYLVSYIPWMAAYEHTTEGKEDCPGAADGEAACEATIGDRLAGLGREHHDIWVFHRDLESTHTYRAQPWTWPVLGRPVAYFYETCKADRPTEDGPCEVPQGQAAEVLALGNPALWWGFIALLPLSAAALGRRDPSAWVLGGFYGGLFLPWLLVSRPAFLFYMVPAIAFMAITVAHALGRLRARPRDAAPWVAAVGAGGVAALSASLAGASRTGFWISFAIGWVAAPLLVAAALDRMRRSPHLEGAADELTEAAPADPGTDTETAESASVEGTWAPGRNAPWWPSNPFWGTSRLPAVIVTSVLLVGVVGALVFFLPVWTGVPMEPAALRSRWWFSSWI